MLIQMEQGREELKTFRLPRVGSGPGDPEKPQQNESSSLSESKAAPPSTGAAKLTRSWAHCQSGCPPGSDLQCKLMLSASKFS